MLTNMIELNVDQHIKFVKPLPRRPQEIGMKVSRAQAEENRERILDKAQQRGLVAAAAAF